MASFDESAAGLTVSFEPEEATLLRRLLDELEQVLSVPTPGPLEDRLFPAAYDTSEEQSAYEELVGDQLRNDKLKFVRAARSALDRDTVVLDSDAIEPWLVVLTDLRLAIGTRLDVTEETMAAELDPEDPDAPALSVLHWLGWMQESLLSHLIKN